MSERSETLHATSEKWAAKLYKLADKDKTTKDGQDPMEELHGGVYGISSTVTMKLTLSGGGPADWLEVEVSRGSYGGWEVDSVTHCANDWFEPVLRTPVDSGDALWRLAEYYAEVFEVES